MKPLPYVRYCPAAALVGSVDLSPAAELALKQAHCSLELRKSFLIQSQSSTVDRFAGLFSCAVAKMSP
jgi:hypothetical protein